MAQKVNPNSFNLQYKDTNLLFNSYDSNLNYYFIFKENLFLKSIFINLFERQNVFIKDCFFVINAASLKVYLYISFLPMVWKFKRKVKISVNKKVDHTKVPLYISSFIKILNFYSFKSYKKIFILKNLENTFFNRKLNLQYEKSLRFFKKESYFLIGKSICLLLNSSFRNEIILIKFIALFLRTYHRQKKALNKFFHFLNLFLNFLYKYKIVQGIKVQIKGRLRGAPRSKKFVLQQGSIPTQTITSAIRYQFLHVPTRYGVFGLKIWVFQ